MTKAIVEIRRAMTAAFWGKYALRFYCTSLVRLAAAPALRLLAAAQLTLDGASGGFAENSKGK